MLVAAGCADDADGGTRLADYLGEGAVSFDRGVVSIGGRGEEQPTTEELRRRRDMEEFVAICMSDRGFEYLPDSTSGTEASAPLAEANSLPPDEFAKQYGYGVSTLLMSDAEPPTDPNQEIKDDLSPQALKEYQRALNGVVGNSVRNARTETPPPVEERGCRGQAEVEVYGQGQGDHEDAEPESEAVLEGSLREELDSLAARVRNDPRVVEAEQRWSTCLADAGYPDFERLEGPQQSVAKKLGELEVGDDPPYAVEPAALAELQEHEVGLATADFRCREEHLNDVSREVWREMEAEFVAEHREELERLRDMFNSDGEQ